MLGDSGPIDFVEVVEDVAERQREIEPASEFELGGLFEEAPKAVQMLDDRSF